MDIQGHNLATIFQLAHKSTCCSKLVQSMREWRCWRLRRKIVSVEASTQNRVQQGQVSRARQGLTGAPLAPQNSATLDELRRIRPHTRQAEISPAVLQFEPIRGLKFDAKLFAHQECLLLLTDAAQDFARGSVPDEIFRSLMLASIMV